LNIVLHYTFLNFVTLPTGAVAKYCNEHVCVCMSVCPHTIFTKFFLHVAYRHGLVLLQWGENNPKGLGAVMWVFFPIYSALYSIAFGTHTKMVKLIEMPFGIMTRVGPRYHVLDGGPNLQRGRGNFWGGEMQQPIVK